MIVHRPTALFLAAALAGSLFAQAAADPNQRTLTQEGVSFKLPAGWQWQSDIASNIAIKQDIKVKDQTYTITAEMVYNAHGFLEDTISDIEKKVATSKGDLKDLKITRGEKFAGSNAAVVTFTRVRGEKHDQFEDERDYLVRRNNALVTWTELAPRIVQSTASTAFATARAGVTFTGKDLSRVPKSFTEQGIKYNLPPDWEYDTPKKSEEKDTIGPIMIIDTATTVKGQSWRVSVQLFANKDKRTLKEMQAGAKEDAARNFGDIQDLTIKEKQVFNGEEAFVADFTGTPDPKRPAAEQPRVRVHWVFMKRKGFRLSWLETGPAQSTPQIEAALKKAREGLTWGT
jgi:hypothetical protein